MTVNELFTKWGFDIDASPLGKLEKGVDSLVGKVNVAGLAVSGFAATLFGLAHFTAEAGDQAFKMSQKLGIGVEELQRLQFAAKLADMDAQSFGNAMKFLSKGLSEAKKGSGELKEAFAKMKLDPKKFSSADQALRALSDKFKAMPDGPEKTAMAIKIFSKSGMDMIPLLNGGSKALDEAAEKADKYGIVLTRAQAEAGEKFNDTLTESKAALAGVRNILGNALIPVLTRYAEYFNDLIASNKELIAQKLQAFLGVLGRVLEIVYKAGTKAVGLFIRMSDALGGMGSLIDKINSALDFILGNDQFLAILGATTIALYGLSAAFTAVNASALLIPLTIAALIGIIALLADDLIAFSQGRDSAFGLLLNFFKKEFPTAFAIFQTYIDGLISTFKVLYNVLSIVLNMLFQIGKYVVGVLVAAFDKLGSAISFIAEKIGLKDMFAKAAGVTSAIAGSAAAVTGEAAGKYGLIGGLGAPPSPTTAPASSSATSNNQNVNANMPITINVPPGGDPAQVAAAASSGVNDGLNRALRESKRTSKPGVKY